MTVGTKDFEIIGIFRPIFKTASPRPLPSLCSNFKGRIDMVNVQHPNIVNAATCTFPAEGFQDSDLFLPILRVFLGQ